MCRLMPSSANRSGRSKAARAARRIECGLDGRHRTTGTLCHPSFIIMRHESSVDRTVYIVSDDVSYVSYVSSSSSYRIGRVGLSSSPSLRHVITPIGPDGPDGHPILIVSHVGQCGCRSLS